MKPNEDALKKYVNQKDRIAELERELKLQKKRTADYKALWRAAIGDHELPTDKARKLIRRAKKTHVTNVSAECRRIAEEVNLSVPAVRVLWYEKD